MTAPGWDGNETTVLREMAWRLPHGTRSMNGRRSLFLHVPVAGGGGESVCAAGFSLGPCRVCWAVRAQGCRVNRDGGGLEEARPRSQRRPGERHSLSLGLCWGISLTPV